MKSHKSSGHKTTKKGFQAQPNPPSSNWLEENITAILQGNLFIAFRLLREFGPTVEGSTNTSLVKMPTKQDEDAHNKGTLEIKQHKTNFSQPYVQMLQSRESRGICYAQDAKLIERTAQLAGAPPLKKETPATLGDNIGFFRDDNHYRFSSEYELFETSLHSNLYFSSPQIFDIIIGVMKRYNPQEEIVLCWSKLEVSKGYEVAVFQMAIIKINDLSEECPIQIDTEALIRRSDLLRHRKYIFSAWIQKFAQDEAESELPLQSFQHYANYAQQLQAFEVVQSMRGKHKAALETSYNPDHAGMLRSGKAMCYEVEIERSIVGGQATVWLIIATYSPIGETAILEPHSFWMIHQHFPEEYGSQEWMKALKKQTSLELRIRTSGKDYYPIAILQGKKFYEYLEALEWQTSNRIAPYLGVSSDVYADLASRIIKCFRNLQHNFLSRQTSDETTLTTLLESVITFIKDEFPPDHELYQKITEPKQTWEDRIRFISQYLAEHTRRVYEQTHCQNPKTGSRKLFQYLSTNGKDLEENLVKDFLFAFSTSLINKSNPRFLLPTGLNSVLKAWNLRSFTPLAKASSMDALKLASRYRYLLGTCWESIFDSQDVLMGNDENTILFTRGLSEVPPKPQFQELTKIMHAASLKQHFIIDQRTTVLVETSGCYQITFTPHAQKPGEFLFKIVIQQEKNDNNTVNSCLVGYLNPNDAQLKWATPVPSEQVEKELDLLLFLVAIAYRDLVVARDRYTIRSRQGTGVSTNSRKPSKAKEIQLIPRFKSILHKHFGDPELFLSAIRRHFSFRSAHIRKLPEGYSPSDTQIELAEQFGFFLPPGYTFVRSTTGEESTQQESIFRSISLMELLCDAGESN